MENRSEVALLSPGATMFLVGVHLTARYKIVADNILKYFYYYFSDKTMFNISCESSQQIHMKCQTLFYQ